MKKEIGKFLNRPIKNKIAKKWIEKQQILKKSGIKEIEVPSPDRKLVKKNKTDSMSGYKQIKEFINKPKMINFIRPNLSESLPPKVAAKAIPND